MSDNIDPIVAYLIIRESLNMSPGKIAAQCSHGMKNLMLHYFKAQIVTAKFHDIPNNDTQYIKITSEWLAKNSRTVVLRASDSEWDKIKIVYPGAIVVKDLGLTEVQPYSETCLALWPQLKSSRDKVIKRLQVL